MATLAELRTAHGIYVSDPTHIGSMSMDINSTASKFADGGIISSRISYVDKLELKIYKQNIRIIQLENKLDSEECANLKAMLESNDEASVILAKEIIDNLETA